MKVRLGYVLAAGLALGGLVPVQAGLDFTLQHKTLSADGLALNTPFITDGPSKIFLRIPADWKVSDSAGALSCAPGTAAAEVRLESYGGPHPLTIDAAGGQELMQQVTAQLPKDAKKVVAMSTDLNPLPLFNWATLEVTLRYEYFGETLRRSVMYLNMLPGRVTQLTVIAPDADFDKIHKQARQLLSSWFEPSRDLPPDLQRKYEAPVPGGS